jgi:KDO2-lipid IV(A) lauroyltransferase
VILLCGHYGNFELCNYMMGVLGFHTYAIARPLDNVILDRFLLTFRSASGQHIIPKDGCAPKLDALMAAGGALGFLVDTHAGPKGCYVNFFGRPASTHKAIAVFAKGYQAPMVFCFGRRNGGIMRHDIGGVDQIDVRALPVSETGIQELTEWFTARLESTIRVDPTQYWWVHRRWKDTREKKNRSAQVAA